MRWNLVPALPVLAILATSATAASRPIIHDPVSLNIGMNCHWQASCMKMQHAAMKQALRYVQTYRPPQWRIELCNLNAGRGRDRVDWVGFDHCIRNASLKAPRKRRSPRVIS